MGAESGPKGERIMALCCECKKYIVCEHVDGSVVYPHRPDLYRLNFVRCPICGNYAGIYKGEKISIPTKYMRKCRYKAHMVLNKLCNDRKEMGKYYKYMSTRLGKDFHWGETESDEEANRALSLTYEFLRKPRKD